MPKKRTVDLRSGRPLLDIASYGRKGSDRALLTGAEMATAARTVRRVPEVMVKVSGGAHTLRGVSAHLDYIGRDGAGELEMDDGSVVQGHDAVENLIRDWDLDVEVARRHSDRSVATGRTPKLVHNIVFSMPRGTPPEKLHQAVRQFAGETFGLEHRYVMALHTDQPNPHVHLVVKARSESGVRLNIRKATLRDWRRDFAECLREQGVPANATERAVRGAFHLQKRDGIYRAMTRGASTHLDERLRQAAPGGGSSVAAAREPGKATLERTREAVVAGWHGLARALSAAGQSAAADDVRRFVAKLPAPQTEREWLRLHAAERARAPAAQHKGGRKGREYSR